VQLQPALLSGATVLLSLYCYFSPTASLDGKTEAQALLQESANYGLGAKSTSGFVNKVLLEHSHIHSLVLSVAAFAIVSGTEPERPAKATAFTTPAVLRGLLAPLHSADHKKKRPEVKSQVHCLLAV
jgi:hypothetical protein